MPAIDHHPPNGTRPVHACATRRRAALAALVAALSIAWLGAHARRSYEAAPFADDLLPASATISRADLREAVSYLASDALAGRRVGEPGNEAAVQYAARALEAAGLQAADGQYRQPVSLVADVLGPSNRLAISTPPAEHAPSWTAGRDYYPLPGSPSTSVFGPVSFVGATVSTGDRDPGATVVAILDPTRQDEPPAPAGAVLPVRPDASWLVPPNDPVRELAVAAARQGARALLLVSRRERLRSFRSAWGEPGTRRRASYRLAEPPFPIPVVRVGARVAARVLALDGNDEPAGIEGLFRDPGRRVKPGRHVDLHVDTVTRPLTTHNVVGRLDGDDPDARDRVVVVGAHLDHDGVDERGRVFNGADDDASGTAAVLEIAAAFARAARDGHRPRRSVVLALWNAEEQGLLGSRAYVAGLRDPARVSALLNLDMVGRHEEVPDPSNPRCRGLPRRTAAESRDVVHVLGYTFSPDLAGLVEEEAEHLGLSLNATYDRNPIDLLRRSDHWPFLVARVPALFLTTGLHPDYHTPRDDADRIDFEKLERVARLAFRVAWRAADAAAPPAFTAPAPEP